MPLTKPEALAALLARAREEHAALEDVLRMAKDEATSDETRPESKYDTRATEASYLAAGQGERLAQLARTIAYLDACTGADGPPRLYELVGRRGAAWFLLAPEGGGQRARSGEHDIVVVTPSSPLGEALAGVEAGDEVELGEGAGRQSWEVVAVL